MVALPFSASRVSFGFREAVQAFLGRPDLPFAAQLDANQIREVFSKHNALFGGLYTTAIVLWAFMGQVLSDGKEASCQSAVAKISAYFARLGRKVPRADTGAYCRARIKLPEAALRELSHLVAKGAQEQYDLAKKWKNRNVYLVDGFTFQMPDTPSNQRKYPQHSAQKSGLGFPIARVVALISLATGCVVDLALGPYKGKATGESALFRSLLHHLQPGDVVVADRHYCSYAMVCDLMKRGVHVCFRQHQARHIDFRKGKRHRKTEGSQSFLVCGHPCICGARSYNARLDNLSKRSVFQCKHLCCTCLLAPIAYPSFSRRCPCCNALLFACQFDNQIHVFTQLGTVLPSSVYYFGS